MAGFGEEGGSYDSVGSLGRRGEHYVEHDGANLMVGITWADTQR